MQFGTVAVLLMLAWFVALWVRKHANQVREGQLPSGVGAPDALLRPYSEAHHDACVQALRAFANEYKLSFRPEKCSRQTVLTLHTLREDALKHMYQIRMRLPNDLDREMSLTRYIEDTDRLLKHYIEETRKRCGISLLHPGPLEDSFYKQFYRASNDVTT